MEQIDLKSVVNWEIHQKVNIKKRPINIKLKDMKKPKRSNDLDSGGGDNCNERKK